MGMKKGSFREETADMEIPFIAKEQKENLEKLVEVHPFDKIDLDYQIKEKV